MKKRWTAALLALALAIALLPAPVFGAAADGSAGSRLAGPDREIYEYLKAEIIQVAQGKRTSTEFRIPNLDSLSWTREELGIRENSRDNVLAKLKEKFSQNVHVERIYNCLSADLPYELFWKNNRYSVGQSFSQDGNRVSVRDFIFRIEVAPAYRGGGTFSVSTGKVNAAQQAAKNAQAIVAKYKDQSDWDKLNSYREEICRLVSYNTAVTGGSADYGDPWQMVYVFDGDPNTNVVCEGYSKAFKYLCDLSQFDGDVVCRIATGNMGAGPHMWNVVQMGDGKNYLADVTNCDSGALGEGEKLFLAGAKGSADGRTWTISKEGLRAVYTYSAEEKDMFTDGWLALSAGDYASGAQAAAPDSSFGDVPAGAYFAAPVAWAVEGEIAKGTSPSAFSPDDPCTHGEILTFLWRAAGEPVSPGDASLMLGEGEFYAGAVRWAAGLGMLKEDFDPHVPCSRADAVQYIWCAFQQPYAAVGCFDDVPSDAEYAPAVGWAVSEGVTTGTSDATFEPDTICSRGQIITFLYRAYQNQTDKISTEIL